MKKLLNPETSAKRSVFQSILFHIRLLFRKSKNNRKRKIFFAYPVLYDDGTLSDIYLKFHTPVGILFHDLLLPINPPQFPMMYNESLKLFKKSNWRHPTAAEMIEISKEWEAKLNPIFQAFGYGRFIKRRWIWLEGGTVSDSTGIFGIPPWRSPEPQYVFPVSDYR